MGKTLYVSDLDGTLLRGNISLSDNTIQTINSLMEKGLMFTYATARSFRSASIVTKGLRLHTPIVLQNGTFIMEPQSGAYLHGCTMEAKALAPVKMLLEREKIPALVYSLLDGRERVSWVRSLENFGICNYWASDVRQNDVRRRPVDSWGELFAGDVFYITVIEREQEARKIASACKETGDYCHVGLMKDTYADEWWVEIHRGDVSKAAALKKLKGMIGAEKLVCFGDNLNDMPMFQLADECYAVANAHPDLKKMATGIIGSNEEDGVARWLLEHGEL